MQNQFFQPFQREYFRTCHLIYAYKNKGNWQTRGLLFGELSDNKRLTFESKRIKTEHPPLMLQPLQRKRVKTQDLINNINTHK